MRIGIYGGTFNPPHIGHVHAAEEAGRVLGLDKLLIVPDNVPPHKTLPEGSPDNAQRLEMARLAFGAVPCAEVSDLELRREGKSYSVDTVRAVHAQYPDAELWLLMGSDMLNILHLWHEPETLMRLANIGTFARDSAGEQEIFARMLPLLEHNFHATIRRIPMEAKKAASSEIRAQLARGGGAELLSPPVWGYIQREHLYGTKADLWHLPLDALRSVALSYLRCTRMAHVLGTEQEAVRLARRCGIDETEARTAALLHDCTKKCSREEQLALCERYGLTADKVECSQDQLLHAKTGAALARDVFGVSDAVYGAIRWHTTGKADMTPLEKVIYVADCIEPSRKYPGVETLRRATEESLDKGLELCLQRTVERMEKLGSPVHERTLEALHFLKGQR